MMPRKDYVLRAEESYRKRNKRVLLNFSLEKDAELLDWLSNQVSKESEIPALIKRLLTEIKQK